MKRLTKKQMKIAKVAPPRNKITKADFDILNKKRKKEKRNDKKSKSTCRISLDEKRFFLFFNETLW